MDLISLFSEQTCGANCWLAKEDICKCSCSGKNHGIMLNGGNPEKVIKIDGFRYKLFKIGSYNDLYHEEQVFRFLCHSDSIFRCPECHAVFGLGLYNGIVHCGNCGKYTRTATEEDKKQMIDRATLFVCNLCKKEQNIEFRCTTSKLCCKTCNPNNE